MTSLANAVRRVATELSDAHIADLAAAYRSASACTADAMASAQRVVPIVHHEVVGTLHDSWQLEPTMPGSALALALQSARTAIVKVDRPIIEVVVTGPDSPAVPIRLTSEVITNMIAAAKSRVTIVSYSVAKVPSVIDALSNAQSRGVKISLIFESADQFDGGGGSQFYSSHAIYHWPAEKRNGTQARLHAKAVIIDARDILVTSANLSNLAYQSSLELGLLCRGGGVAEKVQRHFDALISNGVLAAAS